MVSSQDDFWDLFGLDELPAFEEASDLSRFSVETHRNNEPAVRTLRSRGHLRLTGAGVLGHQASLEDVGQVASTFQKLITALGSSIFGARQSISTRAKQLTELRLDASPSPGSLILNFSPVVDPEQELRGRGEIIDSESSQLIDKTFAALAGLLNEPDSPRQADTIAEMLRTYGSKTSVSLRNFATVAAAGDFDLDLLWQQPRQPSLRMHLPAVAARSLANLVHGRRLDEENVELVGTLTTVSLTGAWVMADEIFGTVAFSTSNLGGEPHSAFNPGVHVRIAATMTTTEAPGQPPTRTFQAHEIERTGPGSG